MGTLQCFCGQNKKPYDHEYTYNGRKAQICMDYIAAKDWQSITTSLMGGIISILNIVLKELIVMLVGKMYCHTESIEMSYVTSFVFYATWANTGWVAMIANSHLADQKIPIFSNYLRGADPDFDASWYQNVGKTILTSMLVNMFMPIIMNT